ncbi:uncharacterized protein P884DRAFT_288484 [Thermothelomyces heterothallicus CBS 202.75]|uniref:uncharacterized protein n=1 Tax=Thermothelomyces heterothallicus CBS 202.75 TaxID=1149848 RepID=UPI003744A3AF
MSADNDTYAPKSPDLSLFYSGPTPPAEPAEPQQLLSQHSQPNFSYLQTSSRAYFPDSRSQQFQPEPRLGQQYQSQPLAQTFAQTPHPSDSAASQAPPGVGVGAGHASIAQHQYYPPRAASYPIAGYSQPGSNYTATQVPPPQQQAPFYQPPYRGSLQYQPPQQPHQAPHGVAAPQAQARQLNDYRESASAQDHPSSGKADAMPPRRAAAAVTAQTASDARGDGSSSPSAAPAPAATSSPFESITVKTKFPTARIKRIMQADEEVGKVAQQTPIAVGKALELFMVALVTKSAEVARQRNSKRVSAQMLKQVVEGDDQWDFLRDIVGKVEGEEKGGKGGSQSQGGRVKAENSETDDEMGGGDAAAGTKKKRGGGRKKKV